MVELWVVELVEVDVVEEAVVVTVVVGCASDGSVVYPSTAYAPPVMKQKMKIPIPEIAACFFMFARAGRLFYEYREVPPATSLDVHV